MIPIVMMLDLEGRGRSKMGERLGDLTDPKRYPSKESQLEALQTLKMFLEHEMQDNGWIRSGLVRLWSNPALDPLVREEIEAMVGADNRPIWWTQVNDAIEPIEFVFLPDGKSFFSLGSDEVVKQWETLNGHLIRTFPIERASALTVSPDGQLLTIGKQDGTITLVDITSGRSSLLVGKTSPEPISRISYDPESKYLLTCGPGDSSNETVKLFEVSTGALLREYSKDRITYTAIFSYTGKGIITGHIPGVRFWDAEHENLLEEWIGGECLIDNLAVSSNGQYLLAVCEESLLIWHTPSKALAYRYTVYDCPSNAEFSWDNTRILYASADGIASLRNLNSGEVEINFNWFTTWISCVRFVPQSTTVAIGSWDGTVKLFEIPTKPSLNINTPQNR